MKLLADICQLNAKNAESHLVMLYFHQPMYLEQISLLENIFLTCQNILITSAKYAVGLLST